MPVYREFKVFIRDEAELRKVQAELNRLGLKLGMSFYNPKSADRSTTITTWKDGSYDIWSLTSKVFNFHGHQDTLTLDYLRGMITAETGEADATTKPATYFDTPKH